MIREIRALDSNVGLRAQYRLAWLWLRQDAMVTDSGGQSSGRVCSLTLSLARPGPASYGMVWYGPNSPTNSHR